MASQTQSRQRRKRRAPPLVYCSIRYSGLTVSRLAAEAERLCFSTAPTDLPRARLVLGSHEHELREFWAQLRRGAVVGRLFGSDACTDKGTNEELTRLARTLEPGVFSEGFLEAWVLPRQREELEAARAAASHESFILKPRNSSEGNGIRLLLSSTDIQRDQEAIVQRYVAKPLLLGGLKFDLRLYVLVRSLRPLELWLFREGLARFCIEQYEPPTTRNAHKTTAFLTNYSLNKREAAFIHSDDPHGGDGSKRSFSSTLPLILEALPGISENDLRSRLESVCAKAVLPLIPFLLDAERQQRHEKQRHFPEGPIFSQLFGLDVLLDEHGAPHLLEVNSMPSMSLNSTVPFAGDGKCCRCMDDYKPHVHVESAVDRHVKLGIMRDMFQLLLQHDEAMSQSAQDTGADAGSGEANEYEDLEEQQPTAAELDGFVCLSLEGTAGSLGELLVDIAEVFGRCCKGGARMGDPFRLRKLFASAGGESREIDVQLRRLAQQPDGLSLLPVVELLLCRLRATQPETSLSDALLAALQDGLGGG